MYGDCCGLGDSRLQANFPWGYLGRGSELDPYGAWPSYLSGMGQDDTSTTDIVGPTLEEIAGGPVNTITAGDLVTYANTGSADPSILQQITNLVKVAGPAVDSIMQQVQIGQLAANTPISQLSQLRAGITGQSTISSVVSSLASNPTLLIGGAVLLLVLMRGK